VIISIFLFAATIVALITGESLVFPNTLLDNLWKFNPAGAALFHSIGRISGVFLLALGVATFFAELGLLRGRGCAGSLASPSSPSILVAISSATFLPMTRYVPWPARSSLEHFYSSCVAIPFAVISFARC
jgi:hypothetical protein